VGPAQLVVKVLDEAEKGGGVQSNQQTNQQFVYHNTLIPTLLDSFLLRTEGF
jgi:hypothetical protein